MNLRRFSRPAGYLLGLVSVGVIPSRHQVAASGNLSDSPLCTSSISSTGDGLCDNSLNTDECGYDGGDCCECTCQGGPNFYCGLWGYSCIDPSASCVEDDDGDDVFGLFDDISLFEDDTFFSLSSCYTPFVSDNDCDSSNNNEACGYDGGDCCSCTCTDAPGDTFQCGENGYACVDPDAPCVNDDDATTSTSSALPLSDDSSLPSGATTDDFPLSSEDSPTTDDSSSSSEESRSTDDSSPSSEDSPDPDDDEAPAILPSDDSSDSDDGLQSPSSAAPSLGTASATCAAALVAVFGAMQAASVV